MSCLSGNIPFPQRSSRPSFSPMDSTSALHDTYYVVAHFHYILGLAVISVVVLGSATAVNRWSRSRLAQILRRLAVASWGLGLSASALIILGWQLVDVQLLIEKPYLLELINDASSVAGFMLLLALALCLAMFLVALWHKAFNARR